MLKSRTQLYLTRSETFSAAWRRFRAVHGSKATPRQHPNYWAACLRMMWKAAKGDAFVLLAVRDDVRDQARKPRQWTRPAGSFRHSTPRNQLKLMRDFAA